MTNIQLSERLKCLADMAATAMTAADIGCDHGRLSVYLAQQGKKVIAVDISPQSLQKAAILSKRRGMAAMVDCRLGDGLQPIKPGEVQAIIISGIGQRNIAQILKAGEIAAKRAEFIVLQPMDGAILLRRELCGLGFYIESERLAKEGKRLHPVIKAVPVDNRVELCIVEQALGPKLLQSKGKYMHEYLLEQQKIFTGIADGLKKAEDVPENELKDMQRIIDAIGEIIDGHKSN